MSPDMDQYMCCNYFPYCVIPFHFSPVPRFESVAGTFEQVALHHHSVGGVHVELHLRVIVGKVLMERQSRDAE